MPDQARNDQPEENQWLAYALRLTAFPVPGAQFDSSNWWVNVTGGELDLQQNNPKAGKRLEVGLFENGKLVLEIQPSRIDWRFISPETQNVTLPVSQEELLPWQATLGNFLRTTTGWLSTTAPRLIRLAFGAQVAIPVGDRVAGYQILQRYLPDIHLDTQNMSDFMYQINRPRLSTTFPNLKLNRLSKWAVSRASLGQIALQLEGQAAVRTVTHEFMASHLELDINTDSSNIEELEHMRLVALYTELVELSQEIMNRGDVA